MELTGSSPLNGSSNITISGSQTSVDASCEDTLSVTGIHKDCVIVKNIHELSGNALIKEIMNADIEIASFDSYRPSLNDIFVKAVGGDR